MISIEKMTDEQIVKELAEKGMKWEYHYIVAGVKYWAHEEGGWRTTGGKSDLSWNPIRYPADRDMLVEAMLGMGWDFIRRSEHVDCEYWNNIVVFDGNDVGEFAHEDDNLNRAVSLAALKAIRAMKENE